MQGGHRGETGKTTVLLGFCRIECRGGRDGNYCVIGVLCGLELASCANGAPDKHPFYTTLDV